MRKVNISYFYFDKLLAFSFEKWSENFDPLQIDDVYDKLIHSHLTEVCCFFRGSVEQLSEKKILRNAQM